MQNLRRTRCRGVGLTIWMSLCLWTCVWADRPGFADDEIEQVSAKVAARHPLDPAIRLAKASRDAIGEVDDYTANFAQRERVGNKMFSHAMVVKHRSRPFSVYMRYVGQHKGREVIYVEKQNEGKLLAHDTGLGGVVGTVALVPTSNKATSESLYPITDFGMLKMVNRVIAEWEEETKYGEVEVNFVPSVRLGKAECAMVETTHPRQRSQFRHHRTRLYIDKSTNHPVRVEHFGFPEEPGEDAPLVAEYQYSDIQVNQSLTDADFDIANPAYRFK